jgi:hypothetical protein
MVPRLPQVADDPCPVLLPESFPTPETSGAPAFGMLTDRFGITWVLDVAAEYTRP